MEPSIINWDYGKSSSRRLKKQLHMEREEHGKEVTSNLLVFLSP